MATPTDSERLLELAKAAEDVRHGSISYLRGIVADALEIIAMNIKEQEKKHSELLLDVTGHMQAQGEQTSASIREITDLLQRHQGEKNASE